MKKTDIIQEKILDRPSLLKRIKQLRWLHKTFAFTNGCFDILHAGHIFSLSQAAQEADYLIVGLNSDGSTRRLKGDNRPINNQDARATVLASLVMVDFVVIFDEDTPLQLIREVKPDVLVKGGDYTVEQIAGANDVIKNGGRVVINPIVQGLSTTGLLEKISRL
jgi:D-beta-D-heptose 7-phosphate kinase/D-beta-D-heptose 1-phosphate adenosyltransferase